MTTDPWREGGISVSEAASFSTIKRAKLYRLMESGELVYSKVGTKRVISKVSLRHLLEAGQAAPCEQLEPQADAVSLVCANNHVVWSGNIIEFAAMDPVTRRWECGRCEPGDDARFDVAMRIPV